MPEPASNNVKQTPGRRRPGQNATRSSSKKTYASENDAAAPDSSFQPDFGPRRQGPQTPKKGAPKSPAPNGQPTPGKSNRRNGNRTHPQNISTSPGTTKPGRRTPPQTAGAKPSSVATAFAGATFHASPAPSSLPLPSFYMKPNSPDTPQAKPASALSQEPSPPVSDSEAPSRRPQSMLPLASSIVNNSPLDVFFRADRAERDRARRASSANGFSTSHTPAVPYSPPAQMHTQPETGSYTYPRHSQQSLGRPAHVRNSSSGISAAELNGTPGQAIGPAFATPFQERMRAARPQESASSAPRGHMGFRDLPASTAPPNTQTLGTDDRSEALKRYLFSKSALSPPTPTANPGRPLGPSPVPASGPGMAPRHSRGLSASGIAPRPNGFAPTAFQNIYAAPQTMMSGGNNQSANIAEMENSLRQILKLNGSVPVDSGISQASHPHRN